MTGRFLPALTFATFALAVASNGCSRSAEQKDVAHPHTMDAAKTLAASRGVPVLIDFYSPT